MDWEKIISIIALTLIPALGTLIALIFTKMKDYKTSIIEARKGTIELHNEIVKLKQENTQLSNALLQHKKDYDKIISINQTLSDENKTLKMQVDNLTARVKQLESNGK